MNTLPGSPQCIAHWLAYGRWHRCTKNSPHRGADHACECGQRPSGFLSSEVHTGRQSFQEFQCHA